MVCSRRIAGGRFHDHGNFGAARGRLRAGGLAGRSSFRGSAPAQELKAWRHSLIAPKADAGFFYMAAKRGFFEREGLKVETLEVKDDAIGIKALLSGEVDSHEGTAGAIAAAARGADVKILGCPWHGVPYVLLARPGITSMEQMRGKSIAARHRLGTPPEMMARASLALFKIATGEVKLAAVGGDRDRYAALLGGVVDAAVVSNEYTPLPQTKNLKVLVEGSDALPKSVRFCVQMTGKTISTRREDAVRFMTAQIKAWRYAVAHRDETIKLTMETTDAKADDPRPAYRFRRCRQQRHRQAGLPDSGREPRLDAGPNGAAWPDPEGGRHRQDRQSGHPRRGPQARRQVSSRPRRRSS